MTSRKEQQADLLIQLGALISPLEELVAYPEGKTEQHRSRACAKFTHDKDSFQKNLSAFMQGEAGHRYMAEALAVATALNTFTNTMTSFRDDANEFARQLANLRDVAAKNILAVPCDFDTPVVEAGSPYSAFMKIRALCETTNDRLIFVDPYMGQGVIRRYFRSIRDTASVTVVTHRRGGQEFRDFIDVSKLFADQRGPSQYQLLFHTSLHDRYLQCDDAIYHLGGSLKDAGRKSDFTITSVENAAEVQSSIEGLIQSSIVAFGASNPSHPTP